MELYDEEIETKKSKLPMIIGICIIILTIIMIAIFVWIVYLRGTITTIKIDGVKKSEVGKLFYIESTENGQELYVPINKIAPFLGYKGYVGDFQNKSEDKTKCYIQTENEKAMYTLDSNIIIKIINNSEYEYINIDKPVIEKDGELYTTIDGIEKGFNILFSSDELLSNISMFTMDYLVNYYKIRYTIENYSEEFNDKKAILKNMIIIKEDEKYGVITVENEKKEYVLESKYDEIKYMPSTTDFLVKSNGKYGIVGIDKKFKVKNIYDDIKLMDNSNGLYLVKQSNVYGIIDINGKIIVQPEYKQIGIDKSKYSQNGLENQYILLDTLIPIKNNQDLWGLFDLKGQKIVDFKYTNIGCRASKIANTFPAVIIPSYKIIIVEKESYYNLITLDGEELIPGYILDTVYLKSNIEKGQNEFFMSYNNDKVINIEDWLASIGR